MSVHKNDNSVIESIVSEVYENNCKLALTSTPTKNQLTNFKWLRAAIARV